MYDFENDPLGIVYADLAKDKTLTPFDRVLLLKGKAKDDFTIASDALDNNQIQPQVLFFDSFNDFTVSWKRYFFL